MVILNNLVSTVNWCSYIVTIIYEQRRSFNLYLSVQRLIWKSRLLRKVEAVINLIHNQKPRSEVNLKLTFIANDAKVTEGGRQN